jgi:hypothetical protein
VDQDIEPADAPVTVALADQYPRLSARDLLHVAVMQRLGVSAIATADADCNRVHSLVGLDPAYLATWQYTIATLQVRAPPDRRSDPPEGHAGQHRFRSSTSAELPAPARSATSSTS